MDGWWMDESMDRWVGGWRGECLGEWMGRWMVVHVDKWVVRVDEWVVISGWMYVVCMYG